MFLTWKNVGASPDGICELIIMILIKCHFQCTFKNRQNPRPAQTHFTSQTAPPCPTGWKIPQHGNTQCRQESITFPNDVFRRKIKKEDNHVTKNMKKTDQGVLPHYIIFHV